MATTKYRAWFEIPADYDADGCPVNPPEEHHGPWRDERIVAVGDCHRYRSGVPGERACIEETER